MRTQASTDVTLDWGVAGRALAGQLESGDRHLVQPFPGGTLVGVVDALGHGEDAAAAAKIAIATLEEHAHEPVVSLVQHCHTALRRTRGVVMTLVSIESRTGSLTWVGVGNVEGLLF